MYRKLRAGFEKALRRKCTLSLALGPVEVKHVLENSLCLRVQLQNTLQTGRAFPKLEHGFQRNEIMRLEPCGWLYPGFLQGVPSARKQDASRWTTRAKVDL